MSRIQISQVGGEGCDKVGIENPAMDPVELNVYGLYSKRNSVTCAMQGELKRKSSSGFTHITRFVFNLQTAIISSFVMKLTEKLKKLQVVQVKIPKS